MIKLISIITLSVITSLPILAKYESRSEIQSIDVGGVKEAGSIFILEVLFANTTSPYPIELWENRNNEELNIFDVAKEIKSIVNYKEKIFKDTKEEERKVLLERLLQMEDIADCALLMEVDKWKADYVNELMKHIIGIRNFGVSDLLPSILEAKNCKERIQDEDKLDSKNEREKEEALDKEKIKIIDPCDEEGRHWTNLKRLTYLDSEIPTIANYMQAQGTDIQVIKDWWRRQVGSSWKEGCKAVKAFFASQRTLDPEAYYWQGNYQEAKDEFEFFWEIGANKDDALCYPGNGTKEKIYASAFTIWHAYVQEVLSKVKFDHNNIENKEVCLIRSNNVNALQANNITHIGKGFTMPNAVYDSLSLFNIFGQYDQNKVLTEFLIPHHRIVHLYSLIDEAFSNNSKEYYNKKLNRIVNFIIKNYYDKDGSLIIDQNDSYACEKSVESYLYYKYINLKNGDFNDFEDICESVFNTPYTYEWMYEKEEKDISKKIQLLPQNLPTENASESLLKIFMDYDEEQQKTKSGAYADSETEFVALTGPDLPFDYFYNNYENLSHYKKRLLSHENVCGFWPKLDDLKFVRSLGGSTGAKLYESNNGKKYVLKKGNSEGHIREEALADSLYDELGCTVPESRLYETPEGPVKVAVFLEDAKPLDTAYFSSSDEERKRLRDELSKGFVVDSLLCNFDVLGLDMDNVLVGEDGTVFRVDNGGSLRYRAQGKLKNDTPYSSQKYWNPSPITLWTLRDPKINRNCALIFADLDIYQIAEKIKELEHRLRYLVEKEYKDLDINDLMENSNGICNLYDNISDFNENAQDRKDFGVNQYEYTFSEIYESIRIVSMKFFDKEPALKKQLQIRMGSFIKVSEKALEMKDQGISSKDADIELRKWVDSQKWGPAF